MVAMCRSWRHRPPLRYTVWPSSRRNCSRQDATRLQLHQRLVALVGYVVLRVAEAVSFKLHINGDKLTGRFEGKGFRNGND